MGAFVQAQNTKTKITVNVLSHKDGKYHSMICRPANTSCAFAPSGIRPIRASGVTSRASQKVVLGLGAAKGHRALARSHPLSRRKLDPQHHRQGNDVRSHGQLAAATPPARSATASNRAWPRLARSEAGWRDRVDYMRSTMHAQLRITDEQESRMVSFLTALFSENSVLPKSPADLPEYKDLVRNFDDDAMNIVYVEYDLPGPNRMPWSAAPDKDGIVWMPYYGGANKIGRLDPGNRRNKRIHVPNQETPPVHSAFPAADGNVWAAPNSALNKLGASIRRPEK